MKWRRGLLLASIHFLIALLLVISQLVPRYSSEKTHSLNPQPAFGLAAYQDEGGTVEFVPICENWRSLTWQEKILGTSELPATILSGWNSDCPARWTIAGLIGIDIRHHTRAQVIVSSSAFCFLIALQWFVLGCFPLIQPHRWWLEPGACNTASTLIVVLLVIVGKLIEMVGHEELLVVVGFPAFAILLLIVFTWMAWLALLLWRAVTSSWKLARRH
jgi:hypothetical protein